MRQMGLVDLRPDPPTALQQVNEKLLFQGILVRHPLFFGDGQIRKGRDTITDAV